MVKPRLAHEHGYDFSLIQRRSESESESESEKNQSLNQSLNQGKIRV